MPRSRGKLEGRNALGQRIRPWRPSPEDMAVLANVLSHAKNSDRFSEVRIFWNGDDIFAVPLGMGDRINLRKPQNAGR